MQGRVFPDLGVVVGQCAPVAVVGVDAGSGEGGDAAERSGDEGGVDVVGDSASSDTCDICLDQGDSYC